MKIYRKLFSLKNPIFPFYHEKNLFSLFYQWKIQSFFCWSAATRRPSWDQLNKLWLKFQMEMLSGKVSHDLLRMKVVKSWKEKYKQRTFEIFYKLFISFWILKNKLLHYFISWTLNNPIGNFPAVFKHLRSSARYYGVDCVAAVIEKFSVAFSLKNTFFLFLFLIHFNIFNIFYFRFETRKIF